MKRILIVDDEMKIRQIYQRLFKAIGSQIFEVREASSAQEATGILIREEIDLVLLDINMPGIDGRCMFEVIQEYDPTIKVIIASVYPVDQQKDMVPYAKDYYDKSQGAFKLLEKATSALFVESAMKEGGR